MEPKHIWGVNPLYYDKYGYEQRWPETVYLHDCTEKGLSMREIESIGEKLLDTTIYFNDLTCTHWFYDFRWQNYWVEQLPNSDPSKRIEVIVTTCDH